MALPATAESTWFRRFHPSPDAAVSLVCLPHAGGTASFYFPISELLPSTVEVLAVQYPGRQDRLLEPPVENVHELARAIFESLTPLARKRPVALFGHSMGASVGFELARLLERELGIVPETFFASSQPAPSRHHSRDIHRLDDDGIIAELRLISGTSSQVLGEPELLRLAMPAIRGDYTAVETYTPEPGAAVRCDVVGLTGDNDDRVPVQDVANWREHTSGSFKLQVLPGGHFYVSDQTTTVAGLIANTLRAATVHPGQLVD
jgi:pyochelin biosynthesis protein PchC